MKKIDDWTGAYPSNWKGVITDGSMVHPAKFSNKLIRKIYEHMLAEGWLHSGRDIAMTENVRREIVQELDLDKIPYRR